MADCFGACGSLKRMKIGIYGQRPVGLIICYAQERWRVVRQEKVFWGNASNRVSFRRVR
jgi:hypothetical protein